MSEKVINQHLQDCFLFLTITDNDFVKIARQCIPANYFSSITGDIARLCYNFYDLCNQAPGNHLYDEVARFLYKTDDDRKKLYLDYLNRVCEMAPPNKEYVLSRVSHFLKARAMEESLMRAAPLAEKGEFDQVEQILMKALKSGIPLVEDGIEYPGDPDKEPSYYATAGAGEIVCPTGISIIDRGIKGLRRGQLLCIFAGFKLGKTWGCVQIASQALITGHKVCEISHEASAEEVEMRHDMMFGSLTSEETEGSIELFDYDEEGNLTGTRIEEVDTVFNREVVRETRRVVSRYGGESIIRKYSMGTCTIGEIERYLDYLETFKHFIPDVLISDYVEKMKLPSASEGRDSINEAYINLKRIADERKIVVITASQVKAKALEKSMIGEADAASEDIRKLGNIDLGLFFGATPVQRRRGLMQAFVLVNRSGPEKFGCVCSRNLRCGQFVLDCWPLHFEDDKKP